jgi:hypothetical protein
VVTKQGEVSENFEMFKDIVKEKHIKVLVVGKRDTMKIEKDLYFDILWPNNSKLISENVLNNNSNIEEMINELNKIDGVNVVIDEDDVESENQLTEISIVVKVNAITIELERILILLEEQDEKGLAIQKLNELIDIFKKIESGVFDINV